MFMAKVTVNAKKIYNVQELRNLLLKAKTFQPYKQPYKPPSVFKKFVYETPFIGPFLKQPGGVRGKLQFVLFKAAGEIPIVGGVIETLGRTHGLVAELPTEDYRRLLKIIGAREGGRLVKQLSPVFEQARAETPALAAGLGTRTVFISSAAAKLSRSPEIRRTFEEVLEGKKLKWVAGEKKIPFAKISSAGLPSGVRLTPEVKSLLFKRRAGLRVVK